MFTGLIESVGEVLELKPTAEGYRLRVRTALDGGLDVGASLAVNGVCLTVIQSTRDEAMADIGPETARVTTLGALTPGTVVNLERPVRADARFGGHFVQGHVDATGAVEEVRPEGDSHRLTVSFPSLLAPYLIHRGAIAVDGISLTIAGLGEDRFDVQVIPHTWTHTNLRSLGPRTRVNLECDMLGKYVVRAAELAGMDVHRSLGARAH